MPDRPTVGGWSFMRVWGGRRNILACLIVLGLFNITIAQAIDFDQDIAPILQTHCLSCHDAAAAQGDVRLDLHEQTLQVITPGLPEESLLVQQIEGDEPAMPQDAPPLSADEVQRLRDWIAAGAPWPEQRVLKADPQRNLDWWSLRQLPEPVLAGASRELATDSAHPVDVLLNKRLAAAGLTAQQPAEADVLIRRLTYDLTGLPPTPEEVAEFSVDHYEQAVDRLLASPAFGEKWARHWLDAARYGETHGYDKDQPRNHAWPYRDYVIAAFNNDKPYPQFVQEQIAGDVLVPDDPDGVIALGFLAAGPWDLIGHVEVGERKIDGRIAKHLDRDEMISAVFNVFTSTTVQCAQCHHHKFDPVKMEDYYRLHAVFAAVDRADREYSGPQQQRQRATWQTELELLEREQAEIEAAVGAAVAARAAGHEQRIAELKQDSLPPPHPAYGWHSLISSRPDASQWVQVDLGQRQAIQQLRLIAAFDHFADIGAGFGFPVRYKVETAEDAEFTSAVRLLHDASGEDQLNPKDEPVTIDTGGEALRYIRVTATQLAPRSGDYIFALGELEAIGSDGRNLARGAHVTSSDSIEAAPRWGRSNLTDGFHHRELTDPQALAELRRLERELAAIRAEVLTPEVAQRLHEISEQRAATQQQLQSLSRGPVVYAATSRFDSQGQFIATGGKPRTIHLLQRGDISRPGEPMHPGMPPLWSGATAEFSLGTDATDADARAALARAIASRENPLLWRSIVNRLWQWTFSQPLVGTPNDFGRMGMQPTHPELLDDLAARLRDDPQHSLKSIIRLLVTSQAYRRSSEHDEVAAAIDADNRLLWRANRRRLTAEEFRDTLLWASGKLRLEERGGPSFRDFMIEKPEHSPHYQYHLSDPNDPLTHRRSIYRFIVRSQPQPLLTVLDCADPSLSVAARDESTTALQALTQWNNRLVEAMSRHFGQRITAVSDDSSAADPVDFACRMALGRPPDAIEHAALSAHLQAYGAASLARVLFNLNAFVYVD